MKNKSKAARSIRQPAPVGKRARTRAALIEAASEIIAEEGYDRLSMDKVAARAGMTKGSIYGNFASKEDLIMDAFLSAFPRRLPPTIQPEASLAARLQTIAEDLMAQTPHARHAATKLVAFQLYALTHEKMRERVVAENMAIYERLESWVSQTFTVAELPVAPVHFVRLLHIVSNGLLVAHALAPELIGSDNVRAIFSALAGGRQNEARERVGTVQRPKGSGRQPKKRLIPR